MANEAIVPSVRIPHLLLRGYLACAQAFKAKPSELYRMNGRRIPQENLCLAHPPLAIGQRQRRRRKKLDAEFLKSP